MKHLLAMLALAAPALAQSPKVEASALHWTARNRPVVTATYTELPGGTILQTFEVANLDCLDRDFLPACISTTGAPAETQAIVLKGFPLGSSWSDYRVFVDCDWRDTTDSYGCENLYPTPFGDVDGGSMLLPNLNLYSPLAGSMGGGFSLYNVSIHRSWTLGYCGAFDQSYDLAGTSGEVKNTHTAENFPIDGIETPHFFHRRYMAQHPEFVVYFAPTLGSTFDSYPLGVRVGADGEPIYRGDEVGAGGGHGGMWPWYHRWANNRWRFTVRFEPQ